MTYAKYEERVVIDRLHYICRIDISGYSLFHVSAYSCVLR